MPSIVRKAIVVTPQPQNHERSLSKKRGDQADLAMSASPIIPGAGTDHEAGAGRTEITGVLRSKDRSAPCRRSNSCWIAEPSSANLRPGSRRSRRFTGSTSKRQPCTGSAPTARRRDGASTRISAPSRFWRALQAHSSRCATGFSVSISPREEPSFSPRLRSTRISSASTRASVTPRAVFGLA